MAISFTPEEIEDTRLATIATIHGAPEDGDAEENWLEELEILSKPGTFSYHEALHTTSLYLDSVGNHVLEHPAVLMDKNAFALAHEAHTALFNLYQYLGGLHLVDDPEESTPDK